MPPEKSWPSGQPLPARPCVPVWLSSFLPFNADEEKFVVYWYIYNFDRNTDQQVAYPSYVRPLCRRRRRSAAAAGHGVALLIPAQAAGQVATPRRDLALAASVLLAASFLLEGQLYVCY